jgi:hypothetical protein
VTYTLTIDQKPTYLHAVVTGDNSAQAVEQYMEELMRECTARGASRVLIEERLVGPRLGPFEVPDPSLERLARAAATRAGQRISDRRPRAIPSRVRAP